MSATRRPGADFLRLLEMAADPASAPDEVYVYPKDVAGVSQLFARVSDGTVYQLTPPSESIEVFSPPEAWVAAVTRDTSGTMSALVSQNFSDVQTIRAGSIVGLRTRFVSAITAGTLTITITINGAPTALSVAYISPSSGSAATWPLGFQPYAAGDLIGIDWSADSAFDPDMNIEAWIELSESL